MSGGLGKFAAKWGAGPTLVATMIGGVTLGTTVAVFQYDAIGNTVGILGEVVPRIGPAIQEGKDAVNSNGGTAPVVPEVDAETDANTAG